MISDIHSNLEAFDAAMESIACDGVDGVFCAGDIVGYGADPSECIKKARRFSVFTVAGNHDFASAGKMGTSDFNDTARAAILWTQKVLTGDEIGFLSGLETVYRNEDFILAHGTLFESERFHYMFDKDSARDTFRLMDRDICFVGHTHVPGMFIENGESLDYAYGKKIKFGKDEKVVVNVGSVGQPRDGDARLSYAVYDSRNRSVEIKRRPYEVNKAQEKILKAGLPASLAYRLSEGV